MFFGYARVSTEGQHDTSIEVQLEYLKLQAERIGYDFKGYYEKASGKNVLGRTVLTTVLNELKDGDILGVYDNSRLGRNTEENLSIIRNLNEKGVQVQINGKIVDLNNPQDKLLFSVESAVSTYQRESQLLKSKAGINQAKKNGDWVMSGVLWGWDVIRTKGKVIATINETAAKYIRYCFEEYAKGISFTKISDALKDVVDTDKRFEPDAIRKIIQRPIYMGYYTLNSYHDIEGEKTEEEIRNALVKSNIYPPIVSEELWWDCHRKWRFVPRTNEIQHQHRYSGYELTGILKCGDCGRTLYHSFNKWQNGTGSHETSSYQQLNHEKGCKERSFRGYPVDDMHLMMRSFLFTTFLSGTEIGDFFKDKKVMLNDTADNLSKNISSIEKEISTINTKIERIVDALSEGIFTKEMAKNKLNSLNDEKSKKETDLANVRNAYLINQGELEEVIRESSIDVIEQFCHDTENTRKNTYLKYLKYANVFKDRFEIEFLNGKKFIVVPRYNGKYRPVIYDFTMYYKEEYQSLGILDTTKKNMSFVEIEDVDEFGKFVNNYYGKISNSVNEYLNECLEWD